jgi:hypothetical protein
VSDDVTLALAIIGAVTGVAATALDLLRFTFDRPRLRVEFHLSRSVEHPALIGINVTNRGRRPTTVLKAAFKSESEAEIRHPDTGVVVGRGEPELTLSTTPTVLAAHGGVHQFRMTLEEWPGPFFADEPLRAYVVDSHKNRPTWGPAPPLLRMLLNNGWQPSGAAPESLEPAPHPIRPQPVEPRWKLWKEKELRKPPLPPRQAWPPSRESGNRPQDS